jgi:hypothetical protein
MTVVGDALGAGTMTVVGACADAGTMDAASSPSATSAVVIVEGFMGFPPDPKGQGASTQPRCR